MRWIGVGLFSLLIGCGALPRLDEIMGPSDAGDHRADSATEERDAATALHDSGRSGDDVDRSADRAGEQDVGSSAADAASIPDGAGPGDATTATDAHSQVDAAAARVLWSYGNDYTSHPAISPSGMVYTIVGNRGEWGPWPEEPPFLAAVRPTGGELWSYRLDPGDVFDSDDAQLIGAPVLAPDGTIYARAERGEIHAINPDGSRRWLYEVGTFYPGIGTRKGEISALALGPDGTIYFTDEIGDQADRDAPAHLNAVWPDGTERWKVDLRHLASAPVVAADGTLYLTVGAGTEEGGRLVAVDPETGAVTWEMSEFGLAGDPDAVLIGLPHRLTGDLQLLSGGAIGMVAWEYTLSMEQDSNTVLLHVTPGGAAPDWKSARLTDHVARGPVFDNSGRAFLAVCSSTVTAEGDGVVAVAPTTGQVTFHASLPGSEHASGAPVLAADGTIYVTMELPEGNWENRQLYAVAPDGSVRWTKVVPRSYDDWNLVDESAPALGPDGTLYLPTVEGLMAIAGSSPPAASPWPDTHGGPANMRSLAPPRPGVDAGGHDSGSAAEAGMDSGSGTDAGRNPDVGAGFDAGGDLDAGNAFDAGRSPSSCAGRCDIWSTEDLCFCTVDCLDYDDCCSDYTAVCDVPDAGWPEDDAGSSDESCAGRCDVWDDFALCACTDDCTEWGDCCDDYTTVCG